MKDIRQAPIFAKFMKDLGWQAEKIGSNFVYLRKFPLIGFFAKIPRPNLPLDINEIVKFRKSRNIFRLKISPFVETTDKNYPKIKSELIKHNFKIDNFPFNPTTDYLVDLTKSEKDIFGKFSEAKRRAVRRALKNKIIVKESDDYPSFIKIRQHQYLPVWFLVGTDMKKLWHALYPRNAALLLAYGQTNIPVAGILLLLYGKKAYYWFASSLSSGKKLFAPTLLVWKAIKLAKKRGCNIFEFEGIYDDRFQKASQSWKGFTKFKEGFGGEKVVYMENFSI